jgi:uracil-DNA glycosylase
MLAPQVILTLGTLPATEIAGVNLAKAHGTPVTQENGRIIMPIYHPNFLILKPAAKRDVWNALQNVQNILKSHEI